MPRRALIFFGVVALVCVFALHATYRVWMPLPTQERLGLRADIDEIRTRVLPRLVTELGALNLAPGAPVFIRIFKDEAVLELFVKSGAKFVLFRSYPICSFSGDLGPKLREGDRQSPEGFYQVGREALNPRSRFHLSFNLGFPNAFDRALGPTGSFLMVHGDCLSVGCYAMSDPAIEEIYLLVEAALAAGQGKVPVHAFPFHMDAARLAHLANNPHSEFWQGLLHGYSFFEETRTPPKISVVDGSYIVN